MPWTSWNSRDPLAEGLALVRVGNREIEGALRLADTARRHRITPHVEGRAQDRKAAAGLAEHGLVGDEGVLEVDLGEVVALERPHRERAELHALHLARVGDEGGDALVFQAAVDRRDDEEEPRVLGVGDEDLGAVQEQAAVDLRRGRVHVAEVGAAAGLGETGRADDLAAGDAGEEAVLLGLRPEAQQRAGDQRVRDRDDGGDHPVDPGQLLADHAVADDVGERAAVFLGDHRAEESQGRELRDQLGGVPLLALVALDVGQDLGLGEAPDGLAHQPLVVGQVEIHHPVERGVHRGGTFRAVSSTGSGWGPGRRAA